MTLTATTEYRKLPPAERQRARELHAKLTGHNVINTHTFTSSSSDRLYEVRIYADGTKSCNCPGWTRRTQPDGSRTCRHVERC